MLKDNQIVVCKKCSETKATLQMKDLNAFFLSEPHLMEDDVLDFEQDIKRIREIYNK